MKKKYLYEIAIERFENGKTISETVDLEGPKSVTRLKADDVGKLMDSIAARYGCSVNEIRILAIRSKAVRRSRTYEVFVKYAGQDDFEEYGNLVKVSHELNFNNDTEMHEFIEGFISDNDIEMNKVYQVEVRRHITGDICVAENDEIDGRGRERQRVQ